MARWTVLDCWEGAYLRVARAWRPPGGRGCLWGALPFIQKHFQEPSDCILVLSFLQMLPLGKEMVLLMEPGFACLTCRSSSHFLSFLLGLFVPVWVQFLYSHTCLNAKPASTSSKLWALGKCSWLLWTSFSFSLPRGHCLSINTIGRKVSAQYILVPLFLSPHFPFWSPIPTPGLWLCSILLHCGLIAIIPVLHLSWDPGWQPPEKQWLGLNAGSATH